MQLSRRQLLQALASTGLASAAGLSAHARPAVATDFAQALRSQPFLAPFKGVSDLTGERFTERVATTGRWPQGLRGRFYRNGPALYERNGERYHHWFDGDGMVQQFSINAGKITHRGRLVQTSKLKAERDAGHFLFSAFGTTIERGATGTGADSFNTANTNAIEHAGRVLAMWEGGSAHALDPADLSTQGPVVWRKDLAQLPFTAHPKVDAAGNLWNIGTQGLHLIAWHVGPDGELKSAQLGKLPYPGGMVHDMALTERYLVVPLPPVKLDFGLAAADGPRRFAMEAGQPLRILVAEKADITRQRVFELPAQMVFHVGNAFEDTNGDVVLTYIGSPDAWFLDRGAVALMSGVPAPKGEVSLMTVRLNMVSGRSSQQALPGDLEFPRVDPRRIGVSGADRARWLLTGVAWKPYASSQHALLHGVQLLDTRSGRARRFDYGADTVAEEHILVPKPGKSGELDAWVLGTTFNARAQATVLNVLDAARLEEGPIAQATLPYVLPLGFHGNFTAG